MNANNILMCKLKTIVPFVLICFFIVGMEKAYAQKVEEVKSKAKAYEEKHAKQGNKNKNNSAYTFFRQEETCVAHHRSHCDQCETNTTDSLRETNVITGLENLVILPIGLIVNGQNKQLARSADDPWINSTEISYASGYDFANATALFQPKFRANWGLFSTEIRLNKIRDKTASFNSFDWQMLKLNMLNSDEVRMSVGIGISKEEGIVKYHTEKSIDFSIFFMNRQLIPTISYRQSGNGDPRKELSVEMEYRFKPNKNCWSASLRYSNQNWYGESFGFVGIGIGYVFQ